MAAVSCQICFCIHFDVWYCLLFFIFIRNALSFTSFASLLLSQHSSLQFAAAFIRRCTVFPDYNVVGNCVVVLWLCVCWLLEYLTLTLRGSGFHQHAYFNSQLTTQMLCAGSGSTAPLIRWFRCYICYISFACLSDRAHFTKSTWRFLSWFVPALVVDDIVACYQFIYNCWTAFSFQLSFSCWRNCLSLSVKYAAR